MEDLEAKLRSLSESPPKPRQLSYREKSDLVRRLGQRTTKAILAAKKDFPAGRIPFLFSSLDSQDVVDVLNNDFSGFIPDEFSKAN